jgi:hypothetical protein
MAQSSLDGWTAQFKPAKPASPGNAQTPEPAKPQPTISSEDRYLSLPWKQSLKKSNLRTILVTTELLENPIAQELYDRLKEWKTMKVNQVSYRLSKMENGTEFLQKWSRVKVGYSISSIKITRFSAPNLFLTTLKTENLRFKPLSRFFLLVD